MVDIKELAKEILKKLKPTTEYDNLITESLKFIEEQTKSLKISATITMGGSYAKNTHIGDSFDCDIFVRFQNMSHFEKNLKQILTPLAKKLNSTLDLIHGSRDYYQIKYDKLTLEIIPVQYIENPDDANHIMDYSPFHVTWVQKELDQNSLQNDIRLMKQFLKANRLYGAESYVSGFSGHVNDIIVLYYGGFVKALQNISKWTPNDKTIIDYSNYYKNMDVTFFMNDSKTKSPLIAVDPIDKHRNAAAALGINCYQNLIKVAKEFLKAPSKTFFELDIITKDKLQIKFPKQNVFQINITTVTGKTDLIGAKLVKGLDYMKRRLTEEGFVLTNTEWEWDKETDAKYFLITNDSEIKKEYLRKGPKLSMDKAIQAFKEKNNTSEFIEQDDQLYVKLERKFTRITEAIKTISKEKFLLEKVQDSILDE